MPDESPDRSPSPRGAPEPPSSSHAETLHAGVGSSGEGDFALNPRNLLAPPQGPGELGRLAHYRVLKVLGQGGMGVVYQAEDTQLQRVVALKAVRAEFAANPTARERFLREARACAALKSDHVVTIYQVGQDRDVPFLAMEFLQGESLEARLKRGGALPLPEVLRIGREVAAGLAAAHAQGLIHRDIKPANIWLEAPTGRVKLLDFGLARAAGARSGLTQAGRVVGTPEFMSPEQARGEDLDARSDLFSLGAVLYTMGSGEEPFQGSSIMAVLTALAVRDPRPLADLNPDVPAGLVALVECLLAKDRAQRLASADEVRLVLEGIAAEAAAPTGTATRARTQAVSVRPTGFAAAAAPPARRPPPWLLPAGIVG